MAASEILVPAKFATQILQLILTCVIYQSQYENLLQFPNDNDAKTSIQAGVTLSVIFLCLEILILFTGITMTFEKTMFIQITLHSLGTVLLAWFILDAWEYNLIWMIFSFFCLVPLILEIIVIFNAWVFRRSIVRLKQ